MKKKDLMGIILNRDWLLREKGDNGNAIIITLDGGGEYSVNFMENGTVRYPSQVGFEPPEFKRWSYEDDAEYIRVYTFDMKETIKLTLPVKVNYNTIKMDFWGEDTWLFSREHLESQVVPVQSIDYENIAIVNETLSGEVPHMTEEQLGVHIERNIESERDFYKAAYWYLIKHTNANQVVLLYNQTLDDEDYDQLGYKYDEFFSVSIDSGTKIIGNRRILIEILGEILIETSYVKLDPNNSIDEDTVLHEKLTQLLRRYTTD